MMKKPNILKIKTLSDRKDDWCDKDVVMLHACFQLLTDCVEKEKLLVGHVDWENTEEMRNRKIEIETLYNWWQERKEKDEPNSHTSRYEEDDETLGFFHIHFFDVLRKMRNGRRLVLRQNHAGLL